MSYKVKTEKFEGPLDLLLSLIEKRKLAINEISLSQVTDDFIGYVKSQENFPIGESAHFILVASTLLLIKSKSLLPILELSEDEKGDIEDLEKRLREYQRIKELSVHVKEKFGKKIMFAPNERSFLTPVFSPSQITLQIIKDSVSRVLSNIPKVEQLPKVVIKKVISLEEMIDKLTSRVKNALKMSFKEFANVGKEDKVNIIVGFLAMLELVKQGAITATQENRFEDIHMETGEVGTPKYS